MSINWSASVLALIVGTVSGPAAYAQQATGSLPPTTVSSGGDTEIPEIVVTARKRTEVEQDVPVSITAFSSEDLQRYNLTSIQDIANMTPGLIIAGSPAQTGGAPTIRGIGAGTGNASQDQAVSINLDGIQVSQGNVLRLGEFDQRQVEVLKGPQALFFGKNSPGGIIALYSNDPGPTFEASARTGYEISNEQKFIEAIVSGPVTDTVGARLVAHVSGENGWYRNEAEPVPGLSYGPAYGTSPDDKEYFSRLTLTYGQSDDKFNVNFKANYSRLNLYSGGASIDEIYYCPLGYRQSSANISSGGIAPAVEDCTLNRSFVNSDTSPQLASAIPTFGDGEPQFRSTQYLDVLQANLRISPQLTLTSITGFYRLDEFLADNYAYTDLSTISAVSDLTNNQTTEELRLASNFSGPANFLVGGFYQDQKLTDYIPVAFNFGAPFLYANPYYDEQTHAYSFFAQGSYAFLEHWELSGGARYSSETKSLDGTISGMPFTIAHPEITWTNTSPEFTVKYKPIDDLTAYASYRQGFVSGGYNLAAQPTGTHSDPSYQPATVKGVEVGVKGSGLENHLRFDAGAYRYKFSDMQISTYDATTSQIAEINAGESLIWGLEGSLKYSPDVEALRGLLLRANANYNIARYNQFLSDCYTGQSIANGCNMNLVGGAYNAQSLAGRPLVEAPNWMGALGATYQRPVWNDVSMALSIDANYTSRYQALSEEQPGSAMAGFVLLNTSLAIYGHDHAWELALIGTNLTNQLRITTASAAPFSGSGTGTTTAVPGDVFGILGQPRRILLQATVHFGASK
jgi:iron complex outermembrane recepter protein